MTYSIHLQPWRIQSTLESYFPKTLSMHSIMHACGCLSHLACVDGYSSKQNQKPASCKLVWRTVYINIHKPKSVKLTISRDFPLCHLSLSSSFVLSFFLQPILFSPHPPHPSLNFWLSRTSRRQGHLTAVAVETENWGFFPPPPFLYCKARRCRVGWDGGAGGREKHEGMTKVKKGYYWQPFWLKWEWK